MISYDNKNEVSLMGCHGGFSLDESVRMTWYDSELILKNIGLTKGMVFIDMGCGDGFFSLLASKIVGATGKVYSVDTDKSGIEKLKHKATELGISNIYPSVGAAEEALLCKKCADIVFYSMVLHDFNDPAKVLLNAKQMLKPTGLVVNLDWKKKKMQFGPPFQIRFSEDKASELITQAGFKIKNITQAGEHHYIITAKP